MMKRSVEKWSVTYHKLLEADREHTLTAKDLETLALAAYFLGKDSESFEFIERAHHHHLEHQQTKQAVRCAFWMGLMLMTAGERARSSGWMARGESLLSDKQIPDCSERGLFMIPAGIAALSKGQRAKAASLFKQAATIGYQFGDSDLVALGKLGYGQTVTQQGDVATGIKLLDEAMVVTETEEVFPVINGIVYCAVIETCHKVGDLRRAQEWTLALSRWCDDQPEILPFRGQCLVRKAEIIQCHGEWLKALEETEEACRLLTRQPGEPAAGEAYYRKAELLRLLGQLEKAEDCYSQAAQRGKKPQPGLALLRLAQGRNVEAEISLRNTLLETVDKTRKVLLLHEFVRVMITVEQTSEARTAADELDGIAKEYSTPYLHALSSHSQGYVSFAEGNFQLALKRLQDALDYWILLQLPYESAHTRELLGITYRQMNDKDNSDAEFAAAKWIFEQLKASPDVQRINQFLNHRRGHEVHGLTLRELQVLQLVVSGKTNKSIANELFISDRTVDRHVSNIFDKLNVSSRVEATTFAITNKLAATSRH